ncbi:DUF983 domain-containing protein [Croceiramulus getboli]|nr:DUF983 domain-containing protein [Flavobacteriaceae bacterium YJPT1-3]
MKFLKGHKLYSILTGTCPVCQEESMFIDPNPYHISNTLKMHERCGHCGTKYKIEPSFFYGAMYVSYGVGIAFAVTTFVLVYYLLQMSLMNSFYAIMAVIILTVPINLRLSRTIWINLFMSYDSKKTNS